jgi:hypothetical protein
VIDGVFASKDSYNTLVAITYLSRFFFKCHHHHWQRNLTNNRCKLESKSKFWRWKKMPIFHRWRFSTWEFITIKPAKLDKSPLSMDIFSSWKIAQMLTSPSYSICNVSFLHDDSYRSSGFCFQFLVTYKYKLFM